MRFIPILVFVCALISCQTDTTKPVAPAGETTRGKREPSGTVGTPELAAKTLEPTPQRDRLYRASTPRWTTNSRSVVGGKGVGELLAVVAVIQADNGDALLRMMTNGDAVVVHDQPMRLVRIDRQFALMEGTREPERGTRLWVMHDWIRPDSE